MTHHLPSTVKPLIGKTIQSANRTASHAAVIQFSDNTELAIFVLGDCCSRSLFYAIEVPDDITGATLEDITEYVKPIGTVEEIGIKAQLVDPNFYLEELKVWDIVIATSKGPIKLCHINSSNGYYDGYTEYKFR